MCDEREIRCRLALSTTTPCALLQTVSISLIKSSDIIKEEKVGRWRARALRVEWMEHRKTPWKLIDVSQYIFGEHLNWIKKDWEKAHLRLCVDWGGRLEINNYDKLWKINGKSSEKENGKSIDNWMFRWNGGRW